MSRDMRPFTIRVNNKEYTSAEGMVALFRDEHPDWGIVTQIVEINHEKQYAIFTASILNEMGRTIATATGYESAKGFPEWLLKAEKVAIRRALINAGVGRDLENFAHCDEDNPGPRDRANGRGGQQPRSAGSSPGKVGVTLDQAVEGFVAVAVSAGYSLPKWEDRTKLCTMVYS